MGFVFCSPSVVVGTSDLDEVYVSHSTVTMVAVNNSTLHLTFGSGDGAISTSWSECLYFSFMALTGGTPDRLQPVGLCKYAVMIEGVLGYFFLALFVVMLARKIIR